MWLPWRCRKGLGFRVRVPDIDVCVCGEVLLVPCVGWPRAWGHRGACVCVVKRVCARQDSLATRPQKRGLEVCEGARASLVSL